MKVKAKTESIDNVPRRTAQLATKIVTPSGRVLKDRNGKQK